MKKARDFERKKGKFWVEGPLKGRMESLILKGEVYQKASLLYSVNTQFFPIG